MFSGKQSVIIITIITILFFLAWWYTKSEFAIAAGLATVLVTIMADCLVALKRKTPAGRGNIMRAVTTVLLGALLLVILFAKAF